MHKFMVIFKQEYFQVVKKKSFVAGIFLTPLLMAGFMLLPMLFASSEVSKPQSLAVIDQSGEEVGRIFADSLRGITLDDGESPRYNISGVFEVPTGDSARYATVYDSLAQAVTDEELRYVVVIKAAPETSNDSVFAISNSTNFRTESQIERNLSSILASKRLQKSEINLDVDSVISLTRRLDLTVRDASGETTSFLHKYFAALIFVMLMFGMIFGYGQLVMRNVIEEKNSRIMEVLVSSVSPFQLMLGKVMALGAATFTQVAIWIVIGGIMYSFRAALSIDPAIERIVFNPLIILSFAGFLLAGYLLYSTLFALLGSIVTSEKEAQNFVFPLTISMMLPVFVAMHTVQEPNSVLSTVLSFIPLFTPTMMTMRILFVAPTLTEYSLFSGIVAQAALGFLLLCLSVIATVWLTAKVFRVGILMYGKRPTLPEIMKWVRY